MVCSDSIGLQADPSTVCMDHTACRRCVFILQQLFSHEDSNSDTVSELLQFYGKFIQCVFVYICMCLCFCVCVCEQMDCVICHMSPDATFDPLGGDTSPTLPDKVSSKQLQVCISSFITGVCLFCCVRL